MSLKNRQDIYESPSQRMDHIDPGAIRLQQDRLLIRELAPEETTGLIVIPEDARGKSRYREGIVVAAGDGNRFIESGITDEGEVRRRLIVSGACKECVGGQRFSFQKYERIECPACYGGGKKPVTVPTTCKPGDRVLFDRRKESQIYINGESFFIVYEDQSVLMIIDK